MSGYLEALDRLSAYGKAMKLSKSELAQRLGLIPNNYHEHEIGKRMISVENLKLFKKNGGNLYYLITGRNHERGPAEELFLKCHSQEQKALVLRLLIANMEYASWMEGGKQEEIFKQLRKALKLFDEPLLPHTMWLRIRKVEYLNQEKMAMQLGIEKRQYRRIEKGGTAAWAVLCKLEQNLHYSPLLFFDTDQYFIDEINYCWSQLSAEAQQFVREMMEAVFARKTNN